MHPNFTPDLSAFIDSETIDSPQLRAQRLREQESRAENDRNRAAENHARIRRLHRDMVIAAALQALEWKASSLGTPNIDFDNSFLTGYCFLPSGTDVTSLIAEIRAQLSPRATNSSVTPTSINCE